jgi:hypothetical protein
MSMGFNHDQLNQDINAVKSTFTGFLKSLGPSQKKVGERPVSFGEEQHIRFRLMLVEWGIAKIIRTVIVIIVGILVYFLIFRNASGLFKVITGLVFLSYAVWMLLDHLTASAKEGSIVAGQLVNFHQMRLSFQEAIKGLFKKKE